MAARRTGKLAHARQMAELIATRHRDRTVYVVGDAAYVGEHLRGLDGQLTWTSRLKVTSVLHALTPPRTGKSGGPRTRGKRLGTPADLARTATWHTVQARRYGRTDTVQTTEIVCLWYGAFHTRTGGWAWSATTSPAPATVVTTAATDCGWSPPT